MRQATGARSRSANANQFKKPRIRRRGEREKPPEDDRQSPAAEAKQVLHMGGRASSLLRREAAVPAPAAPLAPARVPAMAAGPVPILGGAAHLVLEASLGHPFGQGGLLAAQSIVREVPRSGRQSATKSNVPWEDHDEGVAVVRRLPLHRRIQLRFRMEVVTNIGQTREALPEEDEDVCSLCQGSFHGRRLRVLPCGHAFHVRCIEYYYLVRGGADDIAWVVGLTCPLCREVAVK